MIQKCFPLFRQHIKLLDVRRAPTLFVKTRDTRKLKMTSLEYDLTIESNDLDEIAKRPNLGEILTSLQQMSYSMSLGPTQDITRLFIDLVKCLQKVNKEELVTVLEMTTQCEEGICTGPYRTYTTEVYMDALVGCGTPPCLTTLSGAIGNKTIPNYRGVLLLYGVALTQAPDEAVIRHVLVRCLHH